MGQTTFSGPVRSLAGFITGADAVASITAAAVALDASAAGKLNRINVPVATLTLPLITPDNLGSIFTFVSEVAATNVVIQTTAPDKIIGSAVMQGTTVVAFSAVPATTAKITLDGATKGGAVGSMITLQAAAPGKWLLRDTNLVAVGAPATPFSA